MEREREERESWLGGGSAGEEAVACKPNPAFLFSFFSLSSLI